MAELSPGTTLSHYRITTKIGAGGMGQVYRAQDIELGRPVALKFLPEEVAAHQNRLNRFIQEAKAASALNHPNILTVYEIGRTEETTFIATEFVDGLTLRHYMSQRLKLVEILDIAIQVDSALVAAHAAGIVHRDIKPENIMVRRDGIVKLLDFGLAKLTERTDSLTTGSEATTVALVNTEPGAVLGTVAYMAPEQAIGHDVDARADIWSLGVVLYEMVAARTPFEGASKSHIIVAITDREAPPLSTFVPDVPQPLEWIIAETLTKDREERCQTAKELLGKLKRLKQRVESGALPTSPSDLNHSASPHSVSSSVSNVSFSAKRESLNEAARLTAHEIAQPTSAVEKGRNKLIAIATLSIIFVGVVGFALYSWLARPQQFGNAKMTQLTTGGKISGEDISGQVAISPDGRYVVCGATDLKQQTSLWIRQVATSSLVRLVPAESGAYYGTTFSPDGEFIYYVASLERNKFVPTVYRIPVLGGTPAKVLERVASPIAFSPDGARFAFVRKDQDNMSLMLANTDGTGEPKSIAELKPPSFFSTSGPSWSPDGKRIASGMFNGSGTGHASVIEVSVEGGDLKPIGSQKWASVGRLIWLADGSGLIMAARPESSSIGTQIWFLSYPGGTERRITNDLNGYGDVSLGVSADAGTIATIQQVNISSIWVSNPGEDESKARQILKTNLPETVAWAPDGRVVYASRTGENWDIWISNQDGSDSKQLTSDAFIDQQPSVSPDSRFIVFQSNRSGSRNIWRIDVDGNNLKQVTTGDYVDSYPVSSADGRYVFFTSERSGATRIWQVPIEGGVPVQITNRASELPVASPDGQQLAYYYADEQTAGPKLAIISLAGNELIKTVDLPRSVQPIAFAWMPDGKSIAYLDNRSGVLNVWSQPLDSGTAKQLTNFKSDFPNSFAISRDGKIATYRLSATRDIVLIKGFR